MATQLEREGMAGKVQCIYFDPPYGIKYGGNWQIKLNDRDVKDGSDEHLTGEPEQVKAFRDTWEFGIHSYLTYLRDRLLVAKELLTESGSCFIQIGDENVHLVRNIMDEVFGSENFVSLITVAKTSSATADLLAGISDYIIWYAKKLETVKFRQLYKEKAVGGIGGDAYNRVELKDGTQLTEKEAITKGYDLSEARHYRLSDMRSQRPPGSFPVLFNGKEYTPKNGYWKTGIKGFENLITKNRIVASGNTLNYVRYLEDFPAIPLNNLWADIGSSVGADKVYVVQTGVNLIQRCMLMTTDPGDLVLDPTCGSGTTAYVAEQWGRRWITIDTSRIALNIAKTRLTTATFPYYKLHDETGGDIRQGFIYKTVPHITLKSLANNELADEETLYDQPLEEKKKLRVAGPFTVETLQSFEPISPDSLDTVDEVDAGQFEERIFAHLKSAGVKNGDKGEQAVFVRVERLNSGYLHAEGFYNSASGEKKAYLHIGPKFGTVAKQAVNEAVKECRTRGDADWLIILGFSFESNIEGASVTTSMGSFRVDKVRMHDDLMQDGLLKKDKKAASFMTIGEPDISVHRNGNSVQLEIQGLDIYDPIKDVVNPRNIHDIAYWMVDDNYDGSNFIVRQVFFCGGDKDEFKKWQKGLSDMAKQTTKARAEKTLRIELDDEAFDRLYGHTSHLIEVKGKGHKVAVRVISQFGEESTKVIVL
jgi:adenine-specific DNA-methyltransferase